MPWVRLDEHALNHVKVLALSHGAFRLWVEGLAHCQKHLTDGAITAAALKGFRYVRRAWVDELAAALWEPTSDGYHVHDYLQWNDARAKVLESREKSKTRFQRFQQRATSGVVNAVATPLQTGTQRVSPTTTTTTITTEGQERVARASRGIGSGVMAGSLPRDHLYCRPPCVRVCVSERLHGVLRQKFGGEQDIADRELDAFYAQVRAHLPDTPIGDTVWKFWEGQFAARYGTQPVASGKTAGNIAAAARFIARGQTS